MSNSAFNLRIPADAPKVMIELVKPALSIQDTQKNIDILQEIAASFIASLVLVKALNLRLADVAFYR